MADHFTFKDASGTTRTAQGTDNTAYITPATQIVSSTGGAATDDAAAAGPVFPVAGVYYALGSVDEIDNGDLGRARVSKRRALVHSPDFRAVSATNGTIASAGDMEVSTTLWYSGYAAPTTAFFDAADAGFGAGDRFIRIPMDGWSSASFNLFHNLGVNLTVEIYAWISQTTYSGEGAGSNVVMLHTVTMTSGSRILAMPLAGGSGAGASLISIPALAAPMSWLLLKLTPASDPSSGVINFGCTRRA